MEVYIAIKIITFNEIGSIGDMYRCEVFKTEEEAVEYVCKESGGKKPEKNKYDQDELYKLSYSTEWEGDEIIWYIIRKEL